MQMMRRKYKRNGFTQWKNGIEIDFAEEDDKGGEMHGFMQRMGRKAEKQMHAENGEKGIEMNACRGWRERRINGCMQKKVKNGIDVDE